ncbi:TRAP transporter large permease [Vreelandella andesensis]|uniref:TRAP transporter large permease protein n=1 Tax=Vreelandella andesensis TaxID=447567 RepID=A0A3S1DNB7_9GAMM|nr:TRAP transporter large permease [Halomonas andesensis]RUR30401.1 TRAP transporter large permease [Halomonas andesensis]
MDFTVVMIAITLLVLLVLSVPIGVALGMTVIVGIFASNIPVTFLAQRLITSLDSFPLLAVPFFIMAGEIMQKGSMAKRLLTFSRCLVGHITGGLAQVSVLTSLFFGALSGSSPATVAAIGGVMIPTMKKEGYSSSYAAAVNTSAGCLGVMIPPSIPLIIYGTTAGVSVGDLFIAGILPGIFVAGVLMFVSYVMARYQGHGVKENRPPIRQTMQAFKQAIHALMVPVIVLGGIYGGIMTPTEAGVVAVVYALLAEAFLLRSLTLNHLWQVLRGTALTTATIFLLIATASALGQLLLFNNVPNQIVSFLTGISENKYILMLLIILLMLILGTFMDALANILILTPLLLPVAKQAGFDPIHFGIVMIVSVAIGFLTPPVGVNLFVGCNIANISIERLSIAVLPFLGALILALLVLAFVPQLSLILLGR